MLTDGRQKVSYRAVYMGIFSKNIRRTVYKSNKQEKSYFDQFILLTVISKLGHIDLWNDILLSIL